VRFDSQHHHSHVLKIHLVSLCDLVEEKCEEKQYMSEAGAAGVDDRKAVKDVPFEGQFPCVNPCMPCCCFNDWRRVDTTLDRLPACVSNMPQLSGLLTTSSSNAFFSIQIYHCASDGATHSRTFAQTTPKSPRSKKKCGAHVDELIGRHLQLLRRGPCFDVSVAFAVKIASSLVVQSHSCTRTPCEDLEMSSRVYWNWPWQCDERCGRERISSGCSPRSNVTVASLVKDP
jgi:hypothetical protein